jgi:hypothetical protein
MLVPEKKAKGERERGERGRSFSFPQVFVIYIEDIGEHREGS